MLNWIANIFSTSEDRLRKIDASKLADFLEGHTPDVWEEITFPKKFQIDPDDRTLVYSILSNLLKLAPPDFLERMFFAVLSSKSLDVYDRQKIQILKGMYFAQNHRFEDSVKSFEDALAISDDPNAAESSDRIMNYLGVVYYRMGELQKAMDAHQKSLEILAMSENEERKAVYYNNLGIVQKEIGLLREASESFKKALPVMKKLDRPEFLAVLYGNIGTVYSKLDRYDDSLNFQREALKLHQKANDKFSECGTLTNIGNTLRSLEEYAEASKTIKEALKIAEENGFKLQQAINLYNLGLLHKKIGEISNADDCFGKSVKIAEEIGDREGVWRAYLELSDLNRESGNLEKGFEYIKRAESIFERMRKDLKADKDRVAFLTNQKQLTEKLVILELDRNSENIWGVIQDAKSRSLRELLLSESKLDNDTSDSWSVDTAKALWDEGKLNSGDCIIDFFITSDSLIRLLYHPNIGLKLDVKKIPRKKISDEIDRIHEEIKIIESIETQSARDAYIFSNEQEWKKPLQNLYFILFSDIASRLKPFDQLIINPHGVLHRLPFAALMGENGPLVKDHSIVLSPSLPLLKWQLKDTLNFNDGLKLIVSSADDMAELTREEGRQLSKITGDGILVELGEKVHVQSQTGMKCDLKTILALENVNSFKENLSAIFGELSLFHFTGHGVFDASEPMDSYLKISSDVKIKSQEFYHGKFHSDRMKLIALSACETGKLTVSEGDEIWGFARALFGSGAKSLLLSMWKVEDQAGHDLMLEFYGNLFTKNLPLGKSLGLAQRTMLEKMPNSHPFFWAPYQLYGSP